MKTFLPLEPEIDRVIRLLQGSNIRLSLMSLASEGLAQTALQTTARAATHPADISGILPDGSIGILSMRGRGGGDSGFGLQEHLMPGLRSLLAMACEYRRADSISVSVRSVHQWACELRNTRELIYALFATPAQTIMISNRPSGMRPFRHTTASHLAEHQADSRTA